ncbi:60S ribosomal protein L10a-like [Pararge aegeria]|uniref:Large ribosomal subunit protein uL1 n=1 Tax=Pararge aegeria aegeria TaxID=348720 RepID=A0A8S4R106_9NEOP|nr:60S ribosomal protein L10a-like [Pararge aegeria]CAH2226461.1 jg3499 [Pararge aegeria aegeria]
MSKLSRETLNKSINTIIKAAKNEKSDFLDTITVKFTLKIYDPQKNRPLTSKGEPLIQVCILGDQKHCEEAASLNAPFMNIDELRNINQNKKLIRQLAKQFDAFLVSESIVEQIPCIMGPGLHKAGKTPGILTHSDSMAQKIEEITLKIQDDMKRLLCLTTDVGHVEMAPERIADNVVYAVNNLVPYLKKNWNNVKSVYIKSSTVPAIPLDYTF